MESLGSENLAALQKEQLQDGSPLEEPLSRAVPDVHDGRSSPAMPRAAAPATRGAAWRFLRTVDWRGL